MSENKVLIIAEAGVNHNGDPALALQLIDAAADTGADAVKFQTFKADRLVSLRAPKAEYQLRTTDQKETQFEMIRKLELSEETHLRLQAHCKSRGIMFLSSPFDSGSARFLHQIGIPIFKIPSGEVTNIPYLEVIGSFKMPVILSTGMCTLGDIEVAMNSLSGASEITLLHCNTDYPTPFEDVNLHAMQTLAKAFGTRIGYSDHTPGIEASIAAVAMGAVVIEKHLTLDTEMSGPDHSASLNPKDFSSMVSGIRNIQKALGSHVKQVTPSEKKNISIARKSIVASREIKKGQVIKLEDLEMKRPGSGLSPARIKEVCGRPAIRDFAADELLEI